MREISDELKEKLKSGNAKCEVIVTLYTSSSSIDVSGDSLTGFHYLSSSSGEQFAIGCFQSAQLTFSIPLSVENAEYWNKFKFTEVIYVTATIRYALNENTNTYEYFKLGRFCIDKTKKENDVITVECLDAAVKFDELLYDNYFDALKTVQSEGQTKMPTDTFIINILKASSVADFIDETTEAQILELVAVEYTGTTAPAVLPSEISIPQALKLRGKTCREMLMQFCEVYGCFCYLNTDAFLRFKQYERGNYVDEITEDEIFLFNYDGTVKLTGTKASFEIPSEDDDGMYDVLTQVGILKLDDKKIEIVQGNEGGLLALTENNIFLASSYGRANKLLLHQATKNLDITFTPCTISAVTNPVYEIGDLIKVTDHWGVVHNVYVTSISLKDNAEMEITNAENEEFAFIENGSDDGDNEDGENNSGNGDSDSEDGDSDSGNELLGYLGITYDLTGTTVTTNENGKYVKTLKPFYNTTEYYSLWYDEVGLVKPQFPYTVHVDWGDGVSDEITISDYDEIQNVQHSYLCANDGETYLQMIKIKFDGIKSMRRFFGIPIDNCYIVKVEGELTGCENVECFAELFYAQAYLTDVSSNLFINCKNMKDVSTAFYDTGFESIPQNLLNSCNNVLYATSVFAYCLSLKNIPENLFTSFVNCKLLSYAFNDCEALETYPITLFDSLENITDIRGVFQDCSSLTGNVRNLVTLFPNALTDYVYDNCFGGIVLVDK